MALVRKSSLADVPLIVSFIEKKAAYDLALGCFDDQLDVSSDRIKQALFGSPPAAHVLLVVVGTQAVGCAVYQFRFQPFAGRSLLWLDLLFVEETARRRGCGAALLQALGREAVVRDCSHIAWSMDERNALARSFFAKLPGSVSAGRERLLAYSLPLDAFASRDAQKAARQTRPPMLATSAVDSRSPVGAQFGVPQRLTTYKTLVAADVYRDGGSLEVRFACADGSFETLWLQAAPDPEFGVRYIHSDLQIFADVHRDGASCWIEKNSREEEAVLDALHEFLRNPKVAVPFSHRTPDDHYLQTVQTLLESIPERIPSRSAASG